MNTDRHSTERERDPGTDTAPDRDGDGDGDGVVEIWQRSGLLRLLLGILAFLVLVLFALMLSISILIPRTDNVLLPVATGVVGGFALTFATMIARRIKSAPIAWYDVESGVLFTYGPYGAEQRWPRYPGEGLLLADEGRIQFERSNGYRQVVIRQALVEDRGFIELHNRIRERTSREAN